MQTKKKKIEFKHNDIIITKSGYEVRSVEVIEQYISKKNKISISFNVPVCWNPEKSCIEQLKTLNQKDRQWSTVETTIIDRIKFIKRPTCQLRIIS